MPARASSQHEAPTRRRSGARPPAAYGRPPGAHPLWGPGEQERPSRPAPARPGSAPSPVSVAGSAPGPRARTALWRPPRSEGATARPRGGQGRAVTWAGGGVREEVEACAGGVPAVGNESSESCRVLLVPQEHPPGPLTDACPGPPRGGEGCVWPSPEWMHNCVCTRGGVRHVNWPCSGQESG